MEKYIRLAAEEFQRETNVVYCIELKLIVFDTSSVTFQAELGSVADTNISVDFTKIKISSQN